LLADILGKSILSGETNRWHEQQTWPVLVAVVKGKLRVLVEVPVREILEVEKKKLVLAIEEAEEKTPVPAIEEVEKNRPVVEEVEKKRPVLAIEEERPVVAAEGYVRLALVPGVVLYLDMAPF
jgi:hypothetical protein